MENKYLRKLVSELTTGDFDSIDFQLPKKAMEIKLLCCISWFLSDNPLKIYLRETLRENMKQYGDTLKQQVDILLLSKCHCINYILDSNVLGQNSREVFGNLSAYTPKVKIRFLKERKPRREEFHRGFRDKGSRVLDNHGRDEWLKDYQSTEQQNEIEAERDNQWALTNFFEGYTD